MALFNCNCNCRPSCGAYAGIAGAIIGVVAAFLQITGVITVAPVFLWVTLGIAVVYLAVLAIAGALRRRSSCNRCECSAVGTLLLGILGTALLSAVLLAVGIVATSVVSAILVGLLLLFTTLILGGTACLVRCLFDCED